jgi:hypothetical protein
VFDSPRAFTKRGLSADRYRPLGAVSRSDVTGPAAAARISRARTSFGSASGRTVLEGRRPAQLVAHSVPSTPSQVGWGGRGVDENTEY